MRKNVLIFILFLAGLVAILNYVAIDNFLYWRFWWFDILMHFLGGLLIGLMSLWAYFYSDFFKNSKVEKNILIIISLISVWFIGVGWEIFEILIEPEYFKEGYILDTILDLVMDTLGAIVAGLILLKINKKDVPPSVEGGLVF